MYNCRDCVGETKRNYLEDKVKNPIIFSFCQSSEALQRRETERNLDSAFTFFSLFPVRVKLSSMKNMVMAV